MRDERMPYLVSGTRLSQPIRQTAALAQVKNFITRNNRLNNRLTAPFCRIIAVRDSIYEPRVMRHDRDIQ